MARVRAFRGWRYAGHGADLSAVCAPPYDVISASQRAALFAADSHNVVELELPVGSLDPTALGNRYETGAATWRQWRESGVLSREERPALYVLEQRYVLEGTPVRRRALVAEVGLEPFDAGVILPHERTLPKALGDRFELIKATAANFSPVFGLFDDPAGESDALFDAVMVAEPVAISVDADGVESRLYADHEPVHGDALADLFGNSRIFIADGHHRYTTALAHRDLRRAADEAAGVQLIDPDHDFVMMALVNMDDPDLVVLPTHRVADASTDLDAHAFLAALASNFIVEELPSGYAADALEGLDAPAYIVKMRSESTVYLVRLRPETDLDTAIEVERSSAWKSLDVAVLQELILDPLLGIHPDRPETLERLRFIKDATEALGSTATHDVAFVMRATRMDQLRDVAVAGEIMPQKSTYFYPKIPSGLVFRSAE